MPVVRAATETNSRPTQTSGVGLELCGDIIAFLYLTVLGSHDNHANGHVGNNFLDPNFAQVFVSLTIPASIDEQDRANFHAIVAAD